MACVSDAAHASRPPLLRLTPDIRLRLYRYLGLASWNDRPFLFDLRGGRADRRWWAGCPAVPIDFHGLLISCRIIYAEAAALLYSANSFVVHHFAPVGQLPGLHSLSALTEASLRSLSQLTIVVNEAACHNRVTENDYTDSCCREGRDDHQDWSGLVWCREKHCGLHQAPLLSDGTTAADDARRAWLSAAARLFSHNPPGRLALSFVCDIDSQHPLALDLAASLLAPFHLLPRSSLSECRIRLAKTRDWPLQRLAQDAAVHACGLPAPVPDTPSQPPGAATLASLSRELRIRILEYTDLVAPRRQVAWSRQGRAYVISRRSLGIEDIPPTPDELHSEQFFECSGGRPEGCFCQRRHAVFSLHCKCWAPPGPTLFLVCRTLSQEAQYVFFSRNRFVIHDYEAYTVWKVPSPQPRSSPGPGGLSDSPERDSYPFERFAASEFLRDVVPASALAHLRFLELVFPPYPSATWPGPEHPAARDWLSTVTWLQDRLNLPGITLRVVAMDDSNVSDVGFDQATVEERAALLEVHTDLVRPLRGLAQPPGLARFYAHIRCPRVRSSEDIINDPGWTNYDEANEPPQTGPWYDPLLYKKDLKERLERYVMGARYETQYADGVEEPRASDWDLRYYCGEDEWA
ncbi:hypothetical protein C8A05DRAFT_39422 [Staphylotrichum tortipilum]|uniref:Uncharacterized protein n=1 Tax=Staphylotrichum tortipilum TaxID=2831512 RepID=A0AAN6MBM1_9PEZI|nr:hypothetical protein C8A05DRAFT_39422 [Staphylotrichum longicolle]